MNNKINKGFTLIELLAVIVILAVIALIATPLIMGVINNARKNAAENSVLGIKDSVETYVANFSLKNTSGMPSTSIIFNCNGTSCDLTESSKSSLSAYNYTDKLEIKGTVPQNGTVKVSSNGQNIVGTGLVLNGYTCSYISEKVDCNVGVLPNEYKAVEYIESTGTQYIDTGVSLFDKNKHEIYIDFVPTYFYDYNTLYGSTQNADSFEGWIYSTGALAARYDLTRYGRDNTIVLDTRYKTKFKKDGNTLSKEVDGTDYGTNTKATSDSTATLLLFLSGTDYGKYKLYNCKLSINNELVRNLIPCYRKSDNEIGLYDLVTKTFYTNEGTGTFVIPE